MTPEANPAVIGSGPVAGGFFLAVLSNGYSQLVCLLALAFAVWGFPPLRLCFLRRSSEPIRLTAADFFWDLIGSRR